MRLIKGPAPVLDSSIKVGEGRRFVYWGSSHDVNLHLVNGRDVPDNSLVRSLGNIYVGRRGTISSASRFRNPIPTLLSQED